MGKPVQQGLYLASLGAMTDGMNSDVPPVALANTQLSFATNCTMRGNFVTQRSAYQDISLNFPDTNVQTAFEDGLFQGSCYYKPDTGAEQIIVSISGKFYSIIPSGTTGAVADISAPTDNPADKNQSWLWQCEPFVVINDGQSTPAIYNGVSTVRANVGTIIATISSSWAVPDEGNSVAVTFSVDYQGPFNTPLYGYNNGALIGTFEVNTESSSSGYNAILTNIDDTPGALHPDPAEIWIRNSWSGESSSPGAPTTFDDGFFGSKNTMQQNGTFGDDGYQQQTVDVTPPYTGPSNGRLQWTALNREKIGFVALETAIVAVTNGGSTIKVDRDDGPSSNNVAFVTIPSGSPVVMMFSSPDVLLAITTNDFNAPAVGADVPITVDRPITVSGQIVEIDGAHYTIRPAPPVVGTNFYLKSVSLLVQSGLAISGGSGTLGTIPQLPVGRMGCYGAGRNWICLSDGQSYVGGDIVGSSSGSIAYAFRDSVLNVSENRYLAGGGVFRVPSAGQQISAMRFPATLDSSLGQGPLQVFTQDTVFSCNAPVQRAEWQDLTNPIQTQSLVGGGCLSHYSCVAVNGDLWFRADDGIRSLKLARQDFGVSFSNTPQSVEMNRVLLEDDPSLLNFSSAAVFDNRLLMTASPIQAQGGVYHSKLVALNLDPNSSLRVKQPPIYDGSWEGRNILQLVTGTFAGLKRCFALTYDTDEEKIGLTEIQRTPQPGSTIGILDISTDGSERIQWSFESPALFYTADARSREFYRLTDGEIFVKDLSGTVRFKVEYRPDWLQTWTTWHEWDVSDSPNFQPCMGLGTPPIDGDAATEKPNMCGYFFQIRITVTGSATFMGGNFFACAQPVPSITTPMPGLTPGT